MGAVEVRKFLDYLAVSRNVSISTQKTALKEIIGTDHGLPSLFRKPWSFSYAM